MRILVIGGTKFIGPWVVRGLCEAGCEVTIFHRGEHRAQLPTSVREVLSPDAGMPVLNFPSSLVEAHPKVVVHMICMGQDDAQAAINAFGKSAHRFVVVSSGDVYRAYGRFTGLEPGPLEPGLLTEDSPLRTTKFPYRAKAQSADDLTYSYEKILVENEFQKHSGAPATILRLPKVYGSGENANLQTMYGFRNHPNWRWTHGYVENVACAIVMATLSSEASGRIYNVGETDTPTVSERLAALPDSSVEAMDDGIYNFDQNIAYDTSRIRRELNYTEPITYEEGIRRTLSA